MHLEHFQDLFPLELLWGDSVGGRESTNEAVAKAVVVVCCPGTNAGDDEDGTKAVATTGWADDVAAHVAVAVFA